MSDRFLLLCECGKEHVVTPTDAGQEVACECGKKLVVPTLRHMRALNPYQSDPHSRSAVPREKSDLWRVMLYFASGCLLVAVVLLGLAGINTIKYMAIDVSVTSEVENREGDSRIDQMSPAQVVQLGQELTSMGLGERRPPGFFMNILASNYYRGYAIWEGMAGAGFVLLTAVIVVLGRFLDSKASQS